ncbi:MAG: hypothetical protein RR135_06460 [Oscillospiraceae bacterium]
MNANIASLSETTVSLIRQAEQRIEEATGNPVILVAYEAKKSL